MTEQYAQTDEQAVTQAAEQDVKVECTMESKPAESAEAPQAEAETEAEEA